MQWSVAESVLGVASFFLLLPLPGSKSNDPFFVFCFCLFVFVLFWFGFSF